MADPRTGMPAASVERARALLGEMLQLIEQYGEKGAHHSVAATEKSLRAVHLASMLTDYAQHYPQELWITAAPARMRLS